MGPTSPLGGLLRGPCALQVSRVAPCTEILHADLDLSVGKEGPRSLDLG